MFNQIGSQKYISTEDVITNDNTDYNTLSLFNARKGRYGRKQFINSQI